MRYLFLDTSAFIKLYRVEKGTTWLKSYVAGNQLYVSQLVFIESATILGRLYREGEYIRKDANAIYSDIIKEQAKYRVLMLGEDRQVKSVAYLAFDLPTNLRVRALDAIHLAAARITQRKLAKTIPSATLTFVSADVQLLRVASHLGYAVENPENYP